MRKIFISKKKGCNIELTEQTPKCFLNYDNKQNFYPKYSYKVILVDLFLVGKKMKILSTFINSGIYLAGYSPWGCKSIRHD